MKYRFLEYKLLLFLVVSFEITLVKAQPNLQDCFLFDWKPKDITISNYVLKTLPTSTPTSIVTIDPTNVLSYVSKYVFGHNAHTWAGKYNSISYFTANVKNLNPGVIRFPGGSLSDSYFWNATNRATCPVDLPPTHVYSDLHAGANDNIGWTLSLNNYYDLLQKTNSKGIISVNYGYARYGTGSDPVAAAAHLAANWVRYDKGRTRFWEIGNENYGKWELGYEIDLSLNKDGQPAIISGELYGKHCRIFIDSMRVAAREVKNDIKIGVVAMGDESTRAVEKDWNKGLMPQIATKADFLIVHAYYTPQGYQSMSTILNAADNTKNFKEIPNNDLLMYGRRGPLPVALTEWNSRDTNFGQKTSVTNGVFATMVLGEALKNGFGQTSRWAFLNGWNNGDAHSLFATGDPGEGMTQYAPHPTFFYMYYFQKMVGDRMVNSTITGVDQDSVRAYASTFSSGQNSVILLNKGLKERTVNIQFQNIKPGNRYYYYVLNGESGIVYSRKLYVNGQTTTEVGGGPTNYATLQPNAVNIVNGVIKVTLPMYGVAFLVVDKDTTTSNLLNPKAILDVFPNPSNNMIYVNSDGFLKPQIKIVSMNGTVLYHNKNLKEKQFSLDLRNICSKGVFLVNVYGTNASVSKKLILK